MPAQAPCVTVYAGYAALQGCHHVGGDQQRQVKVHVDGHLAPALQLGLLWRLLLPGTFAARFGQAHGAEHALYPCVM